jgi:hypothetical protein
MVLGEDDNDEFDGEMPSPGDEDGVPDYGTGNRDAVWADEYPGHLRARMMGADNVLPMGDDEMDDEEEEDEDEEEEEEEEERDERPTPQPPPKQEAAEEMQESSDDDSSSDGSSATASAVAAAAAEARKFEPVLEPGRFVFREALNVPTWEDRNKPRKMKFHTDWMRDYRGYEWRLMYFPYGNNTEKHSLSVYLEINPANAVR